MTASTRTSPDWRWWMRFLPKSWRIWAEHRVRLRRLHKEDPFIYDG